MICLVPDYCNKRIPFLVEELCMYNSVLGADGSTHTLERSLQVLSPLLRGSPLETFPKKCLWVARRFRVGFHSHSMLARGPSILLLLAAGDGVLVGCRPRHFGFNAQRIESGLDTKVSQFTPVLTPTVATDPKNLAVTVCTPTDNRDNVIGKHIPWLFVPNDASLVLGQWQSINGRRHRTTSKDLCLDLVHVLKRKQTIGTILGNRSIGKHSDLFLRLVVGPIHEKPKKKRNNNGSVSVNV
mmetsp:Transcript_14565/g.33640  ORF Transcript_14565/g.33640 Transcript_14565/m.33640 type:complete len:241 (-) Transcript_14565:747-1469(-)